VYLRSSPQGPSVQFLPRGEIVELPPEPPIDQNGQSWVRVIDTKTGQPGWLAERHLSRLPNVPGCQENVPALAHELRTGFNGQAYLLDIRFAVLPGMVRSLQVEFVSSGVFETLSIPLDDGEETQVEVVWAYTRPGGSLVILPVALEARFPDGQSVLFSNTAPDGPLWTDIQEARTHLFRGRLFYAFLNEFVTRNSIDWEKCSTSSRHLFTEDMFCQVGAALDKRYSGASVAFLEGRQPPNGWMLFGWTLGQRTQMNAVAWQVEHIPACLTRP
jgi:hypothetical protein